MEKEWNDDERDTSFITRNTSTYNYQPKKSICEVMREYYNDQRESLSTWSVDDYTKELKRRLNQNIKASIPIIKKQDTEDNDSYEFSEQDQEQEEEVNTEIMDNEIYKKSWYS